MSTSNKDVKISPGAVVCLESKLKGTITIGSMTVIHPKASLLAEAGPIIVGENNIIEEQAVIIHRLKDADGNENPVPLSIGVNNVFEVGCEIRAKSIGDHNVFEPKCYVGPEVEIGNGCIIGAGCRLTVSGRLPDQTVITGRQCKRSVALDRPPASDDLARQQDELTVMSEIFTKEEFRSYSTSDRVYTIFEAQVALPKEFSLSLSQDSAQTEFKISYLPPLKLVTFLHQDYPSQSAPDFVLSCCWLSKNKLDQLVSELQKLWEENHCEILFTWYSFLKDQSLELLGIISKYDISEKFVLDGGKFKNTDLSDRSKASAEEGKDILSRSSNLNGNSSDGKRNFNKQNYMRRYKYGPRKNMKDENTDLRFVAKNKLTNQGHELLCKYYKECVKELYVALIEYNSTKYLEEFKKDMQECNTCFCQVLGEQCKQLTCGHITCIECLRRMCEVHIKHGTMESIVCAGEGCQLELPVHLIRELVSRELYDQFDQLMLSRTLDKMCDTTYCPQVHCQYPVLTQEEENLAVCPNCGHAFCKFCKRVYHGIEGCRLRTEEKRDLINLYQDGDLKIKQEMEKRYGKKQLVELVNAAKSELWMTKNSKMCPCCHVRIEKKDGCNKMVCGKCKANFCWLCVTRLSPMNPYSHFQEGSSRCFNMLFEGVVDDEEFVDEV